MKAILILAFIFVTLTEYINLETSLVGACKNFESGISVESGRCYSKRTYSLQLTHNKTHITNRVFTDKTDCSGKVKLSHFAIQCIPGKPIYTSVSVTKQLPKISLEKEGLFYKVYNQHKSKDCQARKKSELQWSYGIFFYRHDTFCVEFKYNPQTKFVDLSKREKDCNGKVLGTRSVKQNTCVSDPWVPEVTFLFSKTPF